MQRQDVLQEILSLTHSVCRTYLDVQCILNPVSYEMEGTVASENTTQDDKNANDATADLKTQLAWGLTSGKE